jgi:CRISPR/Cas system CSM-associated protein Csm3 (group 7 of RAMP superfamily)
MGEEEFSLGVSVTLKSDLHIAGPGRVLPLVDRTVEVNDQRLPIIPASSFRGRLRAELERILNAVGERTCNAPRPDRMCPHAAIPNRHSDEEPYYCRACRIFGCAWRLSAITLTDLAPKKEEGHQLSQRTGVSINRRSGTAEEQRLYVIETVARGPADPLCFAGAIEGRLERQDLGWLLAGVKAITHIGSGKARGLGRVHDIGLSLSVHGPKAGQWRTVDWQQIRKEALGADATESNR